MPYGQNLPTGGFKGFMPDVTGLSHTGEKFPQQVCRESRISGHFSNQETGTTFRQSSSSSLSFDEEKWIDIRPFVSDQYLNENSYVDPRVRKIYNKSFLNSFCGSIQNFFPVKLLLTFLLLAFGSFDFFLKNYLGIVSLQILSGIWPDIKAQKNWLVKLCQRLSLQVLYLVIIGAGNMTCNLVKIGFTFSGTTYNWREATIILFSVINLLSILNNARDYSETIPKFMPQSLKKLLDSMNNE